MGYLGFYVNWTGKIGGRDCRFVFSYIVLGVGIGCKLIHRKCRVVRPEHHL